jgi:hypothetical protein
MTRVSAIRQISWTDSDRIFGAGATVSNGELIQRTATPRMALTTASSSATSTNTEAPIGVDIVVTEQFAAAGQQLAVNNGTPSAGSAGAIAPGGVTIGANRFGSNAGNIRLYASCMVNRALSAAEQNLLRPYIGGKAGL